MSRSRQVEIDPRDGKGIAAIMPRGKGFQFVFYGDSCSGIQIGQHDETRAAVNCIMRAIEPPPEFIMFPCDEIIGLVSSASELRPQWAYWFDTEMAWLDRERMPMLHTAGNHTSYDPTSACVFHDVMCPHRPVQSPEQSDVRFAVAPLDPVVAGKAEADATGGRNGA
jgi:hypothetical protein